MYDDAMHDLESSELKLLTLASAFIQKNVNSKAHKFTASEDKVPSNPSYVKEEPDVSFILTDFDHQQILFDLYKSEIEINSAKINLVRILLDFYQNTVWPQDKKILAQQLFRVIKQPRIFDFQDKYLSKAAHYQFKMMEWQEKILVGIYNSLVAKQIYKSDHNALSYHQEANTVSLCQIIGGHKKISYLFSLCHLMCHDLSLANREVAKVPSYMILYMFWFRCFQIWEKVENYGLNQVLRNICISPSMDEEFINNPKNVERLCKKALSEGLENAETNSPEFFSKKAIDKMISYLCCLKGYRKLKNEAIQCDYLHLKFLAQQKELNTPDFSPTNTNLINFIERSESVNSEDERACNLFCDKIAKEMDKNDSDENQKRYLAIREFEASWIDFVLNCNEENILVQT